MDWRRKFNEASFKTWFSLPDSEKMFFTSDTHFNHANILGFCARPFETIKEHDEELVRRWNEKVPEDGIVFHLGDVCFGNAKYCEKILESLNGDIYLVIGNHDIRDWHNFKYKDRFVGVSMQKQIVIDSQEIILNHYPLACFSGSYRKQPVWQLYGHVHTSPNSKGIDGERMEEIALPCQYDVGVDNNNYTPVSYAEVCEIMNRRLEEGQEKLREKLEKYN